jgi:hypothetical protein
MRACALSLFDVDLQTHTCRNGDGVGAGLVHKFGAKTQFLMPLMSWYHSFMEDARIRRGCRGYVRAAVVLIPETTANKTTLLAISRLPYINNHSTQTLAQKVLCTRLPEARIMQRKRNPGMFLLDNSTRGFMCCGSQCGRAPFDPAASSATARLRSRPKASDQTAKE